MIIEVVNSLTFHLGNCGVNLGESFWKQQLLENGLDINGCFHGYVVEHNGEPLPVYFDETKEGRYRPRAIFLDTDNYAIDKLSRFKLKPLFNTKFNYECKRTKLYILKRI